jgi:hypothetical protein
MQIDLLRIRLSDADLQQAIARFLPPDVPVSNLTVSVATHGLVAKGKVRHSIAAVGFEALIKVIANGALIGVQLADLQAMGPLGSMLRGTVAKIMTEHACKLPGVEPANNGFIINVNATLQSLGLASRLKDVKTTLSPGELTAELSGSLVVDDAAKVKSLRR